MSRCQSSILHYLTNFNIVCARSRRGTCCNSFCKPRPIGNWPGIYYTSRQTLAFLVWHNLYRKVCAWPCHNSRASSNPDKNGESNQVIFPFRFSWRLPCQLPEPLGLWGFCCFVCGRSLPWATTECGRPTNRFNWSLANRLCFHHIVCRHLGDYMTDCI
jgi:hypothetical protein